jgi:hypothetical protein
MSLLDPIPAPGSASDYQKSHVQLATTYNMGLFKDDLADQCTPLYGFHIWGPCPRCGHPSSSLVPVKYLTDSTDPTDSPLGDEPIAEPSEKARARVKAARSQPEPEAASLLFMAEDITRRVAKDNFKVKASGMTCRCPVTHDSTNGSIGCGAEWLVAFEYIHNPNRKEITLSTVADDAEARIWVAADAVSASVVSAGQTAMGQAAKWVAVLSTLVGVITVSGIIGGHDTIQALPVWAQIVLGLATLVALFATACMIYQGNIAGLGYPALQAALSEHSLIQADIEPLKEAQASIDRLNRAKIWAIVTGVAALAAVGLFLFVPSAGTDHVKVKYTDTDSIVHQTGCGVLTLDASTSKPKSFKPDHGPAVTFASSQIMEIDAC